jgi:serine/threonine protein kinase
LTQSNNGRFVKLADFGLATLHMSESQSHTVGIGTPKYLAPEVSQNGSYDTKADIYSLGFTILELFNLNINE